jgi:FkbM family methyltransferase
VSTAFHRTKIVIARLLISERISTLVARVFRGRIPHRGTVILVDETTARTGDAAALLFKLYESAESRFLERYVKPGRDVLELGANIGGVSALIASRLGRDDKLIAVEPNPELRTLLQMNIASNNRYGCRTAVLSAAIAASDSGSASLAVEPSGRRGARVLPPEKHPESVATVHSVTTRTLASLIAEHELVGFTLVADVEGAEHGFMSVADSLQACDLVIAELHDSEDGAETAERLIEQLTSVHGFRIEARRGNVVVASRS